MEVAALLALIVGVNEGLQAKGCLVLRLLAEGVQTAGAQVDGIADLTGVNRRKPVLCIPVRICLGAKCSKVITIKRFCEGAGITLKEFFDKDYFNDIEE